MSKVKEVKEITFECNPNNYGFQVLSFSDENIEVIIRNKSKQFRDFNNKDKNSRKYNLKILEIK